MVDGSKPGGGRTEPIKVCPPAVSMALASWLLGVLHDMSKAVGALDSVLLHEEGLINNRRAVYPGDTGLPVYQIVRLL